MRLVAAEIEADPTPDVELSPSVIRILSGALDANLATGVVGFPGAGSLTETVSNIERLLAGAGNDVLTGNDLDNVLDGGAGNDSVSGAGGGDIEAARVEKEITQALQKRQVGTR